MLGCGISLSNVLLHMTCVSGVLVPCWTLYYEAVSGLADDLTGVWVECSAEVVSLVLLDKNLITQINAGGTGPEVYVYISFTLSFLFSIAIMYFMVISMVNLKAGIFPLTFRLNSSSAGLLPVVLWGKLL